MNDRPKIDRLWFGSPAKVWEEALPIGNGRLGAMVFGGVQEERIQLNEETLWTGKRFESDNSDSYSALAEVRSLLFAGRYREAHELANAKLVCMPGSDKYFGSYTTLGEMHLSLDIDGEVENYKRQLILNDAIAVTEFSIGNVRFTREAFVSASENIVVVSLRCDQNRRFGGKISLSRPDSFSITAVGNETLKMTGHVSDGHDRQGMKYAAVLKVVHHSGAITATVHELFFHDVESIKVIFSAGTDYRDQNFEAKISETINLAAVQTLDELRERHLAAHQRLYNRVSLCLEGSDYDHLPTDQRLDRIKQGDSDLGLVSLLFQYGRYLLICSSHRCELPANLQGIWAKDIQNPWNSDYHLNINLQMNYWLVDQANLSECFEPFYRLVEQMCEPGRKTARVHYQAPGWVIHIIHNPWGFTSAGKNPSWGMFPMAGPWLCQHLWEHYAFTGDREYLKKAYSIMKESAEFVLAWLVTDPKSDKLVSGPCNSPENHFRTQDCETAYLTMGPTCDHQIIWDLFTNLLDAAEALRIDDQFIREIAIKREMLLPMKIGSDGRLLEWDQEFVEKDPLHRHVSHLFGLHPGRQITRERCPELFEAARKSLIARGDGGTGWSLAWKIAFWARFGDGNRAALLIRNLLNKTEVKDTTYNGHGGGVYSNLFCAHPPFQIDGNLGAVAGIIEMLVQSHDGTIRLLPALPESWMNGSIKGVRVRGAFELDFAWRDQKISTLKIRSLRGNPATIRTGDRSIHLPTEAGTCYVFDELLNQISITRE